MENIISLIKEFGFPVTISTVLLVFTLKNYKKLQDKLLEKDSTK